MDKKEVMFGDMMNKLQEMKQQVEETKKRLATVSVMADSGNGLIKVIATANREIQSIQVDDELLQGDKEELEELLVVALNRALQKIEDINESEMKESAQGLLPGFPGLF